MFLFSFSGTISRVPFKSLMKTLNRQAPDIWKISSMPAGTNVGVHICSPSVSKRLNSQFRNKPKPTDVLSWTVPAGDPAFTGPAQMLCGEIAVCREICYRQARQNGWDFDTEFTRLLVHGIAHICGHDHQTPAQEKKMLALEQRILIRIGYPNLYS